MVDDEVTVDAGADELDDREGGQEEEQANGDHGDAGSGDGALAELAGDSLVEVDGAQSPPEA